MQLWLLRHGEAEPDRHKDAERQLTAYGQQQVRKIALDSTGIDFDAVLCSPYTRARQTAAIFLSQSDQQQEPQIVPWLTPENNVRDVLRHLNDYTGEHLLLVGHQPLLGMLGSWLEDGTLQGLPLATASLACLQGDFLIAGAMTLVSLQHTTC